MLEPKLLQEIGDRLRGLGFNPHSYRYLKNGKTMVGLYLYGREEFEQLRPHHVVEEL